MLPSTQGHQLKEEMEAMESGDEEMNFTTTQGGSGCNYRCNWDSSIDIAVRGDDDDDDELSLWYIIKLKINLFMLNMTMAVTTTTTMTMTMTMMMMMMITF